MRNSVWRNSCLWVRRKGFPAVRCAHAKTHQWCWDGRMHEAYRGLLLHDLCCSPHWIPTPLADIADCAVLDRRDYRWWHCGKCHRICWYETGVHDIPVLLHWMTYSWCRGWNWGRYVRCIRASSCIADWSWSWCVDNWNPDYCWNSRTRTACWIHRDSRWGSGRTYYS